MKKLNQSYKEEVHVGSPVISYLDLTDISGYLQVLVTSNESQCGAISVHPLNCLVIECKLGTISSSCWQLKVKDLSL